MPAFWRISGHTSRLFEVFAPRLYTEYSTTLNNILTNSPDPAKLYDNSVFAAATFNLGPRTVSYPHQDWANLSWGLCAITALGTYNPDLGGDLVLWNLRLLSAIFLTKKHAIPLPNILLVGSDGWTMDI
ncbi:hypothetical protein B0H34DRAFT_676905 [Crassisporium funariophilum]|nr:hypothetical protein B0H34DRAFT_676905 [Crassisporium funariophilum]